MNSFDAISAWQKLVHAFSSSISFHLRRRLLDVGEALIDLAGVGPAVEHAQIDFLDAALVLLLLLAARRRPATCASRITSGLFMTNSACVATVVGLRLPSGVVASPKSKSV